MFLARAHSSKFLHCFAFIDHFCSKASISELSVYYELYSKELRNTSYTLETRLMIYERRPVVDLIGDRVGATFELGFSALFLGILVGVPIGILAAVKQGGRFDNVTRIIAVVFNAIPVFWLGLILILVFGSWLKVLPMGGRCPLVLTGGCPPVYNRLQYLILPTFILATGGIAVFSRYMRASMLDVIGQDYIRTAKAKGLSSREVWFTHGARNALIPIATFLGPSIAGLLATTTGFFCWASVLQAANINAIKAIIVRDKFFILFSFIT